MTTKRGGATRKAPGGLTAVLFIRCAPDLVARLDAIADAQRAASPGRSVSRADVARELLYRATEPTEPR